MACDARERQKRPEPGEMSHEPDGPSTMPRHVSIVVFRECDPSIIYGVFDTLWAAGTLLKTPPGEPLFTPRIVAAEHGPMELITGVSIVPQDSIDDVDTDRHRLRAECDGRLGGGAPRARPPADRVDREDARKRAR